MADDGVEKMKADMLYKMMVERHQKRLRARAQQPAFEGGTVGSQQHHALDTELPAQMKSNEGQFVDLEKNEPPALRTLFEDRKMGRWPSGGAPTRY